jgi:hypothetical protein
MGVRQMNRFAAFAFGFVLLAAPSYAQVYFQPPSVTIGPPHQEWRDEHRRNERMEEHERREEMERARRREQWCFYYPRTCR